MYQELLYCFFKWAILFLVLFKLVSRIRTWIIGVEGKHADHLTTTTTAQVTQLLAKDFLTKKLRDRSPKNPFHIISS